uniref:Uncharacterized protein n=1 Tax=Populus alba TaxID=43335 RepID=A0A4U5QS73_POPAL|nr:hypothetical protein D5086_0000070530 [Populus alba]
MSFPVDLLCEYRVAVIFSVHRNCLVIQLLEPAEVEAMDVSGGNFTTTSLVTEGELATDPINGNANDQPYLVKPCEDPDSRFRIEEAEILVKSLNERRLESDREDIISKLRILHEREKRLKDGVVLRKQQQGHLLVALDKLSFTNSAYQDREINLCLVDDDINCRGRRERHKLLAEARARLRRRREERTMHSSHGSILGTKQSSEFTSLGLRTMVKCSWTLSFQDWSTCSKTWPWVLDIFIRTPESSHIKVPSEGCSAIASIALILQYSLGGGWDFARL